MKEEQMKKAGQAVMIICPSCGGEFEDALPKCPYCDFLHIKGAEAEYMEKLEDVREDMAELGELPREETRKELKGQGKVIGVIFAIFAVLLLVLAVLYVWDKREEERDAQEDYLWKQENFPIMEELYEQGKYEELWEFYRECVMSEKPVWEWDLVWFCNALDYLYEMKQLRELEQSGEQLMDSEYTSWLYNGWHFKSEEAMLFLTEEQVERIAPQIEQELKYFDEFWQFDEATVAEFEKEMDKNDGHISYEYCRKYVKEWKEKAE